MPTPIETIYLTGATLYAVIHNPSGTVWNNNTLTFETYNAGNWSNYAVPLTEQAGSGYYRGTYPAGISGVLTSEVFYEQKGGAPALSDAPPAGIIQSQGPNVGAIAGNQPAAQNLGKAAGAEVAGAAVTGTLSITQATTDLTQPLASAYVGRTILWISGALSGMAAGITAYAPSNGLLTFTALPAAPANGDKFLII